MFPEPVVIRAIKDIEKIEEVPWQERLTVRATYDLICQGAAVNPDATAISYVRSGATYREPQIITYRELLWKIHQFANLLHDLGVRSTDVIAFLLPNLPEAHYVLWGSQAAGIVYPINYLLEPQQIIDLLRVAQTRVLVALGPSPEFNIWEKTEIIRQAIPDLIIIQIHGDEQDGGHHYHALINRYPGECLQSGRHISPQDIAAYFTTGGTTGLPKIALHTHLNETFEAWVIALMANRRPDDVILSGLPLFHVNAVHIAGLSAFAAGSSIVLLGAQGYRDRSIITNFWKIVAFYRATSFNGVPTLFASLLDIPRHDEDISTLRYVRCGAAPTPPALFKQFEAELGIKIIEGYGLTEGTCSSTANPPAGERRIGSVGLRYPYQQIKIVELDDEGKYLRDCQPGEIGHVAMSGPHVIPGYLQEAHNHTLWIADGWINTGDLGRMDADGYLWITGRAKDLIIRGGHNIDPTIIEDALHKHPAVALAAAVGKPDRYAGEIPVAYVQLKPGLTVSPDELLQHASRNIPERAATPKEITILDKLPQTSVGKLFKPPLRQDATRRAYEEALFFLSAMNITFQVEVSHNPTHGMLARIILTGAEDHQHNALEIEIQRALDVYSVAYQIEWQ
jgi:fatty-acyl-CoA synthase